jgi:hypothetical protein
MCTIITLSLFPFSLILKQRVYSPEVLEVLNLVPRVYENLTVKVIRTLTASEMATAM